MKSGREVCAPSTRDLGFFYSPAHTALGEQARGVALAGFEDLALAHRDDASLSRAVVVRLADAGLLDVCVPPLAGGRDFGRADRLEVRALCVVRECLGWSSGLADTAFAMQGLGSWPIALAGTDAQKAEWLPQVRNGRAIAAFAITEPEAGSDVAAMRTIARREGEHYVLEGGKCFISNAGVADVYVVFAKTDPEAGSRGVSAFIVQPTDPGFVFEGSTPPMAPHPLGALRFDRMRIPASRRLGEAGEGFRIAMGTLDVFRSTVGAAACGIARRALDASVERVKSRVQFGRPLAEFQLVRASIAEMATELDAARLMVFRAAHAADTRATRVSLEASMAKMFATETAQGVVDRAVQVHGGAGVIAGAVTERLYREVRALRIYEGTTEIQKLVIAGALLDPPRPG